MRKILALGCVIAACIHATGQPLSMRVIDERVGLSSRSVTSAFADRHGFLWFLTRDGVDRWDGRSMHSYTHRKRDTMSIARSWAPWGMERPNGELVFLHSKGMSVLDRAQDGFRNYVPTGSADADNSLHGDPAAQHDSLMYIWAGGNLHTLLHVPQRRFRRLRVHDPRTNAVTDLSRSTTPVFDHSGRLWAMTPVGLATVRWPDSVLRVVDPSMTAHPFYADKSLIGGGRTAWCVPSAAGTLMHITLSDHPQISTVEMPPAILGLHIVHASVTRQGELLILLEDNRILLIREPNSGVHATMRIRNRPDGCGMDSVLDGRAFDNSSVVYDAAGTAWWTGRKGIFMFDPSTDAYAYHPVTELATSTIQRVRMLAIDSTGNLVLGLHGVGIGIVDPRRPIQHRIDARALLGNTSLIRAAHIVALDAHRSMIVPRSGPFTLVVASSTGDPIQRWRLQGERVVPSSDTTVDAMAPTVQDVHVRPDGSIWLASRGIITQVDLRTKHCRTYPIPPPSAMGPNPWAMNAQHLFEDPRGTLWAATEDGLLRFDPSMQRFVRTIHGAEPGVLDIHAAVTGHTIDPKGAVWVHGMMQFGRLSEDGTRIDVVRLRRQDPTMAEIEGILALSWIDRDRLLVVDRYSPSVVDMRTRVMRRLPSPWTDVDRAAFQLAFEDGAGSMWLVTSQTLQRLDMRTLSYALIPLSDDDGAYRLERATVVRNGAAPLLWLAHTRGTDIIATTNLRTYDATMPIVFTSVHVHDSLYAGGGWIGTAQTLTLTYADMPFTITFAAMAPTVGEHLRYRYLLEGVDERWILATARLEARYQNVEPGTYAFRVQYMGLDGRWHEPRRPLTVTITPPWWQTWWFRVSMGCIVLVAGWGAYRRRVHTLAERNRELESLVQERTTDLAAEREKSESLLLNVLPSAVAQRLKSGERDIADLYPQVSIVFADIVGFTPLSSTMQPKDTVRLLNDLFSRFDRIARQHGVERIKTIGDAYMAAVGVPTPLPDHAVRAARFAMHLLRDVDEHMQGSGMDLHLRIGINCGEAVAAVVGESKFAYDLWSDAVNVAARMEVYGEPDRIHCTQEFADELRRLSPTDIAVHLRGTINVKGKGDMTTYWITAS